MSSRLSRRLVAGIAAVTSVSLLGLSTIASNAASSPSDLSVTQGLRKSVTTDGMFEHLAALQRIADANGGSRVSGFPAYDQSVDYVEGRLQAAGYQVTVQPFEFPFNADRTPPVFQQTAPDAATYADGVDFASMTYSGNGDVTAAVTAVDLVVPAPGAANGNTSGCEPSDFVGFPAGTIALVQRGTCPFRAKADNAEAAGASAVIVFNEGQPGRTAAVAGTLSSPGVTIPVVGTTFAIGDDLRNGVSNGDTGSSARVRVDRVNETRTTYNVLAETPTGDPNNVIVVGAHLDSVPRGPGINDNGSGSAGILEIAESIAAREISPRNKIRFAFFGAEEFGLLGSRHYVGQLRRRRRTPSRSTSTST